LTTAILQIESLHDKLAREEQARKVLEEEKRVQGLKTTQAILKAQKESMGALESVGTYKLQIENMQRELSVIFAFFPLCTGTHGSNFMLRTGNEHAMSFVLSNTSETMWTVPSSAHEQLHDK
jgi:hypothetical protein